MAGKNPKVITDGEPEPEKYYAVAKAAVTGIFTDWDTVSLAIKGMKGPKYKKFGTMAEAFEFIKQWGDEATIAKAKKQLDGPTAGASKTAPKSASKKNAKVIEEDGEDFLAIYTDGSSLANGKAGALAGVGVFFGDGDPRFAYHAAEDEDKEAHWSLETSQRSSRATSRPTSAPS